MDYKSITAKAGAFFWVFPVLLAILLYWPALHFGLVWDDFDAILEMLPAYQNFWDPFTKKEFSGLKVDYYRPLFFLSAMLERKIGGGGLAVYHASLLVIHSLSTLLVFCITRLLLKEKPYSIGAALLASLFFALHPVHIEVVCWISGRVDGLLSLFILASLLFFLLFREGRRKIWLAASLVSFFLALLSKEVAAVFFLCLLFYDFLFPLNGGERPRLRFYRHQLYFLLLLLVYLFLRHQFLAKTKVITFLDLGITGMIHKILALYGFYIQKTVFPSPLNAFVAEIAEGPLFFLSLLFFIFVGILGITAFQKGKGRLVLFHILFFLIILFPAVFVPLYPMAVAERYLYLPSYSFCFLLGWLLVPWNGKRGVVVFKTAVILVLLSLGIFKTVERIPVWQDEFSFWKEAIAQNPRYGIPYERLAGAYHRKGDEENALRYLSKAVEVKNTDEGRSIAYNAMGGIYLGRGEYDTAIGLFQKSIEAREFPMAICNLGDATLKKGMGMGGDSGEKEKFLNKAIESLQRCASKSRGEYWNNRLKEAREALERLH